jgi:small GTP-binding protein
MKKVQFCMLGDGGVGKTAIVLQFVQGKFVDGYIPAVEDDFEKSMKIGNETVKLEIVDTAGQEEFQAMRYRYLSTADAFVLVFSLDNPSTVNHLLDVYQDACEAKKASKVPCIIAANKYDLPKAQIHVNLEVAHTLLLKTEGEIINTSAKTGENIDQLFQKLLVKLISNKNKSKHDSNKKSSKKKDNKKDCLTS